MLSLISEMRRSKDVIGSSVTAIGRLRIELPFIVPITLIGCELNVNYDNSERSDLRVTGRRLLECSNRGEPRIESFGVDGRLKLSSPMLGRPSRALLICVSNTFMISSRSRSVS
jgi:hypothetical protein